MSLLAETGMAAGRAAAVATAAVAAGFAARGCLAAAPRGLRAAAWALLLAPYLTPVALVGYAYANLSLSIADPAGRGALYAALLWMKLTPLAALVLYFAPSALSPEAVHCHRMLSGPAGWLSDAAFELRGMARACGVALALVFLLAFAEFDLASLLYVESWTVKLFDAHAGRLALSESLWFVAAPALIEVAVVGALLALLAGAPRAEPPPELSRSRQSRAGWVAGIGCVLLSVAVVTLVPLGIMMRGAAQGMVALARDLTLGREIGASLFFGGATAFGVYALAGLLLRGRRAFAWAALLSVPGLLGPLVLSLVVLYLFQAALWPLYDTPLPLLVALVLVFLPFALLLRVLLKAHRPGEALHAAELLGDAPERAVRDRGARLAAFYRARGRFWVLFLLFCWAYFDLTASAILAPTKMSPFSLLLYNQIHYGRSFVLSAMLGVSLLVPLLVLGLAGGARAVMQRARIHV